MSQEMRTAGILLGLFLAVALAFWPALSAEFVSFDDPENLVQNTAWRGFGAAQLGWMWSASHLGHFHPLAWMSFAFDHGVLGGADPGSVTDPARGGLDPTVFHRTNLILHALTVWAVFFVVRRLLELSCHLTESARALGAAGAALAFAVHPLRVESVAWVTERRDVLSGLFFVLSIGAWLRFAPRARAFRSGSGARVSAAASVGLAAAAVAAFFLSVDLSGAEALAFGAPGPAGLALALLLLAGAAAAAARIADAERSARTSDYLLAVLLLVVSLTAKAWGIVMPALLLVLDVWPLARTVGHRAPGFAGRLALLAAEKAPLFALTAVFAGLAAWAQGNAGLAMQTVASHGVGERLAQGLYGLAWYPFKTLLPLDLSPIYQLPAELSLGQARFALPAVAVVAVTVGLFVLRRRLPGALAAWIAFGVIVSPVLGVAQSGPQLVADRYSYLSCLPFAALFGWLVARVGSGGAARGWGLVAAVALVAGAATHLRTRVWHDSNTLWEAAYAVNPEDGLTLLSLGAAREAAARLEPDPAARLELLREAERHLRAGQERMPNPRFAANLGQVHAQLALLEPERAAEHRTRALEYAERALALAEAQLPGDAGLASYRLNLGAALLNAGRPAEAVEPLQRFVERRPDDVAGRLNLGTALALGGRPPEALEHFERAVELAPDSPDAWGKLGEARRELGQIDAAAEAYRRVLELVPGHPAATQRLRLLEGGGGGS